MQNDDSVHESGSTFFYLGQRFTNAEFDEVVNLCTPINYKDGEIIFKEGDKNRDLFILVNGTIRIEKINQTGEQILLNKINMAGSILGELGLILKQPRSATCIASGNVDIITLSSEKFDELIESDSIIGYKLAYNILGFLAGRQDTITHDIMYLMNELDKSRSVEIPRARRESIRTGAFTV